MGNMGNSAAHGSIVRTDDRLIEFLESKILNDRSVLRIGCDYGFNKGNFQLLSH